MDHKMLLDITSQFESDGAYERAMRQLEWHHPNFDLEKNVNIFEEFLGAWRSLRGGSLDKKEVAEIWMSEIEPYALILESEFLEDLDLEKTVEKESEKLRVGMAIEHVYGALSSVSAIGDTNACKLLHLRLPNLIVMTDVEIRRMFVKLYHQQFEPYSYTFGYLKFVKRNINEVIDSLCNAKSFGRQQSIELLRNAHGRTRSLAKLMDECYFLLAHKNFPVEYYIALTGKAI